MKGLPLERFLGWLSLPLCATSKVLVTTAGGCATGSTDEPPPRSGVVSGGAAQPHVKEGWRGAGGDGGGLEGLEGGWRECSATEVPYLRSYSPDQAFNRIVKYSQWFFFKWLIVCQLLLFVYEND